MATVLSTYSGLDTNGSISSPLFDTIQISGIAGLGLAEAMVRMTVPHAVLQSGMDGAVVPSYVPGEQGEIELQVWQTSSLHAALLAAYNSVKTAADAGNVSNAFGATVFIQNTVDGSSHTGTGCAIEKVPDKTYQEQAQRVTWKIVCANLINEMPY